MSSFLMKRYQTTALLWRCGKNI